MNFEILLAVILGTAFGFILHRIGAADSNKIVSMLRLRNTELMKTILLGIGVGAVLLFTSNALGLFDVSHFSIKSLYIGVLIGGLIFGIGWAISGYCPGTSVSALGSGKIDALVYILGGLFGAFLFSKSYAYFDSLGLFEKLLDGKNTLISFEGATGLLSIGSIGGIIFGAIIIAVAIIIPKRIIKAE